MQKVVDLWEKTVTEGIKNQNARQAVEDNSEQSSGVQNEDRNNPYGITEKDIKNIQNIGRKSIFNFNSKEISLTEPWAREFWKSIGIKSPFFRAWFGDWRENENSIIDIARTKGDERGSIVNNDTGWIINVSAKVKNETKSHNFKKNVEAKPFLPYINDIVKKAVLFDTFTSNKKDTEASLFMHSFYSIADIGNGTELLKLYVEELYNPNSPDDIKRAYQLQNIEKSSVSVRVHNKNASSVDLTDDIKTISDLWKTVKQKDKHFKPKSASKIVDEDGKPLVVYHGTDADFTVFDKTKGRSGMDIQGMFFSPWELDAGGYGSNVRAFYLNIKNPAPEGLAYKVLNKYAGENYAGIKAREELERMGYDGVNNGDEEYIAFYPEQIKSATDNIGTFDKNNPDIQYQSRNAEQIDRDYLTAVERGDLDTAQRMVDEAAKAAGYDLHLYHGSKSGGGFTVFKDWQYFTGSKDYADRYTNRDSGTGLYDVYVKSSRMFDTRNRTERELFNKFRMEYGMGELQKNGLPDWTDGYDIAEIIEENNLDYDGIVLDEGGDLVNGKPVSRGESYVIRKSNQIKSADAVTYDDNGEVIPLSERFKAENKDIRYQDRNSEQYTYDFEKEYLNWNKRDPRKTFRIGYTSKALKSIGVEDKNITWDASKIIKIKNKHPEMTDSIILQVPKIIADPIFIAKSKSKASRITLFGEVYSENKPILAILELAPKGRKGADLDEIKLVSAYGKDRTQRFIDESEVLYVVENKKRASLWEKRTGLQLPVGFSQTNSNNIIHRNSNKSNLNNAQKSGENSVQYQDREGINTEADYLNKAAEGSPDFDLFDFDDTDDDLFENEDNAIDFDKMVKDDPQQALELMYKSIVRVVGKSHR